MGADKCCGGVEENDPAARINDKVKSQVDKRPRSGGAVGAGSEGCFGGQFSKFGRGPGRWSVEEVMAFSVQCSLQVATRYS